MRCHVKHKKIINHFPCFDFVRDWVRWWKKLVSDVEIINKVMESNLHITYVVRALLEEKN